jgi:hypothetical protein
MSGFKYPDHNDHPDFEKLQAERVRLAQEKEVRMLAAQEDKRRAELEAKAAEQAAIVAKQKAERAAYQAKMAAQKDLDAKQKQARDARYAARKARLKKAVS